MNYEDGNSPAQQYTQALFEHEADRAVYRRPVIEAGRTWESFILDATACLFDALDDISERLTRLESTEGGHAQQDIPLISITEGMSPTVAKAVQSAAAGIAAHYASVKRPEIGRQ